MLMNRSLREWISSFPLIILILMIMGLSLNEKIYAQVLKLGEAMFGDYYLLRADIPTPSCDPNQDIEAAVRAQVEKMQADAANDPFGGVFGASVDESAVRTSLAKQRDLCVQSHEMARINQEKVTGAVRAFRVLDYAMLGISDIGRKNLQVILLALIMVCALTATLANHHISLRSLEFVNDYKTSAIAQLIANLALTYSAWSYLMVGKSSSAALLNENTRIAYIVVFGMMCLINIIQLFRIPKDATPGGSIGNALLAVPLYAYMTFIAAWFFLFAQKDPQGLILYVDKIMEAADLFLKIGLFIWAGLLLKQTHIGEMVFRIFKPWKLPPEMLAFFAIFLMAVPTAYTGASGAIIVAMGGVIFAELRRAGARRNLALAATAMTGSLGVVLSPCLLVVIIAIFNKEVTTDDLFHWGTRVFLLTSLIFFVISFIAKDGKMTVAPASEALKPSLQAFIPLIPYALIMVGTAYLFDLLLGVKLDENSAATIVPVSVLLIVFYEKMISKPHEQEGEYVDPERQTTLESCVRVGTTNTSELIGGLLLLIALSMALSGVIEETHFIEKAAAEGQFFHNQWAVMTALILVVTLIGLSGLEPFGAIILVSGSLAKVAYHFGIDPIHFWMLVLVSFELAFLAPPVGLNHLLTRHAVGDKEVQLAKQEAANKNFWYRHERYLLPMAVMGTTMLTVGYGPLIYKALVGAQ